MNTLSTGVATVTCGTPDMLGHSRNSSTTSQMSRASGYSTQHSRQSSSGDSAGHIRFVINRINFGKCFFNGF